MLMVDPVSFDIILAKSGRITRVGGQINIDGLPIFRRHGKPDGAGKQKETHFKDLLNNAIFARDSTRLHGLSLSKP